MIGGLISLQYCVGFFHPSTRISHKYTHVSSLLNFPYANKCNLDKWSDSLMDANYQGSFRKKIDNVKIRMYVKEIRFVDKNLTTKKKTWK